MRMDRSQRSPTRARAASLGLAAAAVLGVSTWSNPAEACTIAAISIGYSENGRPIILKNRDDAMNFFQSLRYYEPVKEAIGGHVCLEEYFWATDYYVCSGGANAAGFAVLNTSVYEQTAVHEFFNTDTTMMKRALETCATVQCFEDLIAGWNDRPGSQDVSSGNFVAMDAHGGIVLLETNSGGFGGDIQVVRHDVNALGYASHTNYNSFIDNPGRDRRERAQQLLGELADSGQLTPLNVMQTVTRDVCGQIDVDAYDHVTLERFPTNGPRKDPNDPDSERLPACISRAFTTASLVIEGVAAGSDPRLTTLWANLGEPAVGVYVPVFPAAGQLPDEVDGRRWGHSPINLEIVLKELQLYDNNGAINGLIESPIMDTHMNKARLPAIQELAFGIEDELYARLQRFRAELEQDPSRITPEALAGFADSASHYAYRTYGPETRPWYNRSTLLVSYELLVMGLRMMYNTTRWALDMYDKRDEIYAGTLEGAVVTWRYLLRQIPHEVQALMEALSVDNGQDQDA